jgi:hypothetical protein
VLFSDFSQLRLKQKSDYTIAVAVANIIRVLRVADGMCIVIDICGTGGRNVVTGPRPGRQKKRAIQRVNLMISYPIQTEKA